MEEPDQLHIVEYKVIWGGHLVGRLKLNRSLSQPCQPYIGGDCHSPYFNTWFPIENVKKGYSRKLRREEEGENCDPPALTSASPVGLGERRRLLTVGVTVLFPYFQQEASKRGAWMSNMTLFSNNSVKH